MPTKLQKYSPYLLAAASGLLLALAYPPYDVPGLIWIALVPLFFVIFKTSDTKIKTEKFWQTFGIGVIFGLIYSGITCTYLLRTYPLGWAGISDPLIGRSLVFSIWTIFTILGTLPFTLMIGAAIFFKKRLNENRTLMIFPFLWVVFEYLRAYFISIALYGKGALLGPHWTTGHLGYALHDNNLLLQSADIWGVYGLSWLVVAINASIFYFLTRLNNAPLRSIFSEKKFFLPFLILIAALFYGEWRLKNIESASAVTKPVSVALIQTDFQPNYVAGEEHLRTTHPILSELINEATRNGAEIIVLPEGSQFLHGRITSANLGDDNHHFLLIDNVTLRTETEKTDSVLYFDSRQKLIAYSSKTLTVPFGEYLPYVLRLPAKLMGLTERLNEFENARGRASGQKTSIVPTAFGNIGVTICSEPLSPPIARNLSVSRAVDGSIATAALLFNISSQAIFHGSAAYAAQNEAVIQLRAVENRRPIAQATNANSSFIVTAVGKIEKDRQKTAGNSVLYGQVRPSAIASAYNILGEWVIILSGLALFGAFLIINNKKE